MTDKRSHVLVRGRGVTAAWRAFTSPGGGSNPSDPIAVQTVLIPSRHGTRTAASFRDGTATN